MTIDISLGNEGLLGRWIGVVFGNFIGQNFERGMIVRQLAKKESVHEMQQVGPEQSNVLDIQPLLPEILVHPELN